MLERLPLVPSGTTLPPLPYLVVVLLGAAAVAVALRRRTPAVTARHVLGLAPWMVLGSTLHVLYVLEALPPIVAPFAGSPTVYVTVATLAGATWLVAEGVGQNGRPDDVDQAEPSDDVNQVDRSGHDVPRTLAAVGTVLVVPVVATAALEGVVAAGVFWSAVAVVLTVPVVAGVWVGLTRLRPATSVTGGVGVLVVVGHALDGVSTAIGVSQLGFGERTPLSRMILELGGVPAVPILGEGWLFLLVKLAVAAVVVWLFVPYVREEPTEGYLLLGFIAAVGLGPAAHNLLLFSVA